MVGVLAESMSTLIPTQMTPAEVLAASRAPDVVAPGYTADIIATPHPERAMIAPAALKQHIAVLFDKMGAAPNITDQASADTIRAIVKEAGQLKKQIEVACKLAKQPSVDLGKMIDKAAKVYIDQVSLVIDEGKAQETAFIIEQDRLMREQEAAQHAAEAAAAQTTEPGRVAAPLIPLPQVQPVSIPTSTFKDVIIENAMLIPMQYRVLDLVKIRVDALRGINIPGVRVTTITSVVAR